MMNRRENWIPLGRVFGIPLGLDYSWFLIFGLLTWSLATNYYPARYADWTTALYWTLGALTTILLFGSVLLHEFGHALVAKGFNIPVRRIRLMVFGGVAELEDESPTALSEFLIAIAGPLVSLFTAAAAAAAWLVLGMVGGLQPVVALVGYLAFVNLMLAVFNLIPGFPLDGGRVLRAIIWGVSGDMRRSTLTAAKVGRVISFGFIGVGALEILTGSLSSGLWTIFIGIFLQGAARSEVQALRVRDLLSGRTAAQLMTRSYVTLPADLPVQRVLDAHIMGGGWRAAVVVDGEQPVGVLTPEAIGQVAPEQRGVVTVGEAMLPLGDALRISPGTELWTALRQMELRRVGQLPVIEDGRLLGVLRREDIFGFLRTMWMLDPQAVRA